MTILQEVCLTRTSPRVLVRGAIDQFKEVERNLVLVHCWNKSKEA
jgi:hypothetical protein